MYDNLLPPVLTLRALLWNYIFPAVLFVVLAAAIYPFYQYRIVSDDISYLAIAQRYLNGDYSQAINAYWSPLNVWLLVLLVKVTGWSLLPAAYILNSAAFLGLLGISTRLCWLFIRDTFEITALGICLALFWAANIPVTHFADALNSALLLGCLALFLRKNFTRRPGLWFLYGLLCAIAYFSKAYSFYILPLSTAILLIIRLKQEQQRFRKWAVIMAVIVITMILCSGPWLFLIYQKYGIWTASTAGAVNTNWSLKGYIYFASPYNILVPPAHADSLSCWEDMWINRGEMLSWLQSPALLYKQLLRVAANIVQWVKVINEFSPFYLPLWALSIAYLLRHRKKESHSPLQLIIVSFLVFPVGYFLLSFGTRYLWYTVPLVMITGLVFFRQWLYPLLTPRYYRLFLMVYFISWLPGAVGEMKVMFHEGKSDFERARQLQQMGITGSFVANTYNNYQSHFRLSYFSGNPFYIHFGNKWPTQTLVEEALQQKVRYFFYFYEGAGDDYQLRDPSGYPYPERTQGKIDGLKVFELGK